MSPTRRHPGSARPLGLCVLVALLLLLALLAVDGASARSAAHRTRCGHKQLHGHGRSCAPKHRLARRRASGRSGTKGASGTGTLDGSGSISQSAAAGASPGSRTACADATLVPDAANLDRINASVLCMVNEQRAKNGLGSLAGNPTLGQVAAAHDVSMVAGNYFDHAGADGLNAVTRILSAGYAPAGFGYDVGENLGWGTKALAAPIYIVANWMNSPEHRANILNQKFKDTGISVLASVPPLAGAGPGAIYTEEFGDLVAPKTPVPLLP